MVRGSEPTLPSPALRLRGQQPAPPAAGSLPPGSRLPPCSPLPARRGRYGRSLLGRGWCRWPRGPSSSSATRPQRRVCVRVGRGRGTETEPRTWGRGGFSTFLYLC